MKRRTAERRAGGKKRARLPGAGKMPRACARRFLDVAVELDAHAQRLGLLEAVMVVVAGKAGVPF